MLSSIAIENKDIIPVFAAHIYKACPTAIPSLPIPSVDSTEEEFMQSLGMLQLKKKTDSDKVEYESFEAFLSRTEGIISLVANIMSSQPSTHMLLEGNKGAIQWLNRFLALLPASPQAPLPLVTAPVLDAFLRGAGHMLANHYRVEFQPLLDTIQNDIIHRLDVSAIGMPSSIRLKKAIEGGMEGFVTTLPSRAMWELYYGGAVSSNSSSFSATGQQNTNAATSNMFGSSTSGTTTSSGTSSKPPNPFGTNYTSNTNDSVTNPSPFGTASISASTPFGGFSTSSSNNTSNNENNATTSIFGGGGGSVNQGEVSGSHHTSASPFGTTAASFKTGGTMESSTSNSISVFGGSGTTTSDNINSSPFGTGPNSSSTLFGGSGGLSSSVSTNPSPFGVNTNTTTSGGFGNVASSSFSMSSNTNPFGATGSINSNNNNSNTTNNTMFGTAPQTNSNNTSTFGGGGFGGFASASSSSTTPFGSASGTNILFGGGNVAPISSPFGGGGGGGNTLFGSTSSSLFGSSTSSTTITSPFGTNQQQPKSNNNRPPCRFFAEGRCNRGADCQFSHETQQQSSSTTPFSTPFGGRGW